MKEHMNSVLASSQKRRTPRMALESDDEDARAHTHTHTDDLYMHEDADALAAQMRKARAAAHTHTRARANGRHGDAGQPRSALRSAADAAAQEEDPKYAGMVVPTRKLRQVQGLYDAGARTHTHARAHEEETAAAAAEEDDDDVFADEGASEEGDEDEDEDEDADEDDSAPEATHTRARGGENAQASAAKEKRVHGRGRGLTARDFVEDIDAELEALEGGEDALALTRAPAADAEEDANKAAHLHNQLLLGEAVLETRIRLQAPLLAVNRLPAAADMATALASSSELRDAALQARNDLAALIIDLARLRHSLAVHNPESLGITKRRRREDEEDDSDAAGSGDSEDAHGADDSVSDVEAAPAAKGMLPAGVAPLGHKKARMVDESDLPRGAFGNDATELTNPLDAADVSSDALWRALSAGSRALLPWRKDTVDSWGRKLAFASGLSAKKAVKLRVMNADISEQVAQVLRDRERVKARSRPRARDVHILGGGGSSAGNTSEDAVVEEGYVDDEFYQQLLKDFVAASAAMGDGLGADGPKRHPSVKRDGIDRRATKGRRLKYNVHPKLVNFMAPAPFVVPPDMAFDLDTVIASLFKAAA